MQGKPLTEARNKHHGQEGIVLDADEGLGEGIVIDHGGLVEAGVQALEKAAGEREEGQVLQAQSHACQPGRLRGGRNRQST